MANNPPGPLCKVVDRHFGSNPMGQASAMNLVGSTALLQFLEPTMEARSPHRLEHPR
jgi:hypothetical protein